MQKIQLFDWLHFKFKFQIQIFKWEDTPTSVSSAAPPSGEFSASIGENANENVVVENVDG